MQIVASDGRGLWERDEEPFSTLWDTEKGGERMWSGAELTGVQSTARPALITVDVFDGALRGQVNISKNKAVKTLQWSEAREESRDGLK